VDPNEDTLKNLAGIACLKETMDFLRTFQNLRQNMSVSERCPGMVAQNLCIFCNGWTGWTPSIPGRILWNSTGCAGVPSSERCLNGRFMQYLQYVYSIYEYMYIYIYICFFNGLNYQYYIIWHAIFWVTVYYLFHVVNGATKTNILVLKTLYSVHCKRADLEMVGAEIHGFRTEIHKVHMIL